MNATAWAARAEARRFDMRWVALGVTTIGSFMTLLDGTIVNIALPSVLLRLQCRSADPASSSSRLHDCHGDLIPVSGYLGDRFGMKRLYMATLVGFTLSSALSAWPGTCPSLIAFRAFQGLGGGVPSNRWAWRSSSR